MDKTPPLRARAEELLLKADGWIGLDRSRYEHAKAHNKGGELAQGLCTLVRDLMAENAALVEAEKAVAIRCGELLMELGTANKRIAQLEHRPETKAEALRSLGLRRGKAADGTEVWE